MRAGSRSYVPMPTLSFVCLSFFAFLVATVVSQQDFQDGILGASFTGPADSTAKVYLVNSTNSLYLAVQSLEEYERDDQSLAWGPVSLGQLTNLTTSDISADENDLNYWSSSGTVTTLGKGVVTVEFYTLKPPTTGNGASPGSNLHLVITLSDWDYERYLNEVAITFQINTTTFGTASPNRALSDGEGVFDLVTSLVTVGFWPYCIIDGSNTTTPLRGAYTSVENDVVEYTARFPYFPYTSYLQYGADIKLVAVTPTPHKSDEYFFHQGEGITVAILIGLAVLCFIGSICLLLWLFFLHEPTKNALRNRIAERLEAKGLAPPEEEVILPESESEYESDEYSIHIQRDSDPDSGTEFMTFSDEDSTHVGDSSTPRSGSSRPSGSDRRSGSWSPRDSSYSPRSGSDRPTYSRTRTDRSVPSAPSHRGRSPSPRGSSRRSGN